METSSLLRRFIYYDDCYNNNGYYCNSQWDRWGRWVLLACIIVAAFLIFFFFSCITARRRRRMGYAPYRGTGWTLGRTPPGHAPAQYTQQPPQENVYNAQPYYGNNNSNNAYQAPPPAYGAAQDYYGASNNVELQQPQNAYKPPQGPPPGHQSYA
ncbi:hypothetical protein EJ03DRAFT_348550 [Teratosphaeria nubilosa]|uniref:Uncharacterized protein n=1 Tax=Teratosphaeria nubilosa TaxID=161662 RepID=A0A6G1LI14_9PEZI|nr:hypothetical protein EJ03DRAFT_348550 [Teratosphaeria nubilosa]